MIQALMAALICFFYASSYSTYVTFHNKSRSVIDVSAQSYATLEPFKELICYIDNIKPNETASCHLAQDRCLGAIFVHEGSSTKLLKKFVINPSDTCRDFAFTITEQSGSFYIQE